MRRVEVVRVVAAVGVAVTVLAGCSGERSEHDPVTLPSTSSAPVTTSGPVTSSRTTTATPLTDEPPSSADTTTRSGPTTTFHPTAPLVDPTVPASVAPPEPRVPAGAFEKTAKGAGEFAAWFAKMPEIVYALRSTELFREQFSDRCRRCAGDADLLDAGIREGHYLKSSASFAEAIYSELDGDQAVVIAFCHVPKGELFDASGTQIATAAADQYRRYLVLEWSGERWHVIDSRLAA